MKYSHHFVKISGILITVLVFNAFNALAQTDNQQMRLANSLERNHEFEAALKLYKNLENNSRFQNQARHGIQNCLKGLRKFNDLVTYLEKIVGKDKTNYKNINSLAEAYLLNSEKERALKLWESLLNNYKDNISVYRIVAGSMIRNRLLDNAIAVYEKALANINDQLILHIDLAALYESLLNMGEAAKHYLMYYAQNANQKSILQRHILKLTKSEPHIDIVANVLKEYLLDHPEKNYIKEILGGLYIKSKQFKQAFFVYNELEDLKENGNYLFQFGLEAKKNGAYEFAVEAFIKILENEKYPIYPNAYFELARTYYLMAIEDRQRNESIERSIQMFQKLASSKNVHNFSDYSCVFLGDIYLNFYFDLDKAISYYESVYKNYPKSKILSESLVKLGDSYLIKGDFKRSELSYKLNKSNHSFSITTFKLAELDYYRGNFNAASEKYNLILKKEGVEDSLANNALERNLFITSFKMDPVDLQSFAHGELLVFQQKHSEAIEHLNKLLISRNNISSSAGRMMVNTLIKLEKFTEANEILSGLIDYYPNDYYADEFLFKSAEIEQKLGNYQKSFELYQTLLDKFETSLYYEKARENARMLNEKIKKEQISG